MPSLLEDAKPLIPSMVNFGEKKNQKQDLFWTTHRELCNQKLSALEMYRWSWWQHWARLAEYFLPRRYHWLIIANRTDRGFPINQNIIDATPVVASRVLASGLMSGLTNPTRPWFRLEVPNPKLMESQAVKIWLDEVQRRMMRIMAGSNFYDSLAQMYYDLVVFGTAPVIMYEDNETLIRCYNPCAGEYYLGVDETLRVDTLGRKFTLTINQIVGQFGEDNVDAGMLQDYKAGGAAAEREYVIAHMIEPNRPVQIKDQDSQYPVPRKFKYRETYWVYAGGKDRPLAIRGFNGEPFIAPRWDVTSNDPYGRSPCMDALPDNMQLQLETKRKAEAIEKQVRPPLLADVSLKNEPTSSVAGGITYVANLSGAVGMKPVYEVNPDLGAMREDLKEIQERIKNILFNDLFLMISNLDTVRSATEVDARREEKLVQLGPVIERLQNEGLSKLVYRVFEIAERKGMIPPAPPELQGVPIEVKYVSMLAEAQRATDTASIERLYQFAGNIAGAVPDILDNLDSDEAIDVYADLLHVDARVVRDPKKVAQLRQKRQQQQQQADILQQTLAGAKGAKDLSDTNVGGGRNVLQMMMGSA